MKDRLLMDASADGCGEGESGTLLADLERRQDDVLAQLDELDRQLSDLLRGLGVTLLEDTEAAVVPAGGQPRCEAGGQLECDDDEQLELHVFAARRGGETTAEAKGFAKLPCEQLGAGVRAA